MHFLFLKWCEIVWKILENSKIPATDIKDDPVQKGEESRFQSTE